jgi:hypothetical protein
MKENPIDTVMKEHDEVVLSVKAPLLSPEAKALLREAGYVAASGAFAALAQWAVNKQLAVVASSQDPEPKLEK